MRKFSLLMFAALTLGVIGCGKDGPAEPAKLSAEQIEAANLEQKKTEDEERAHHKGDRSNKRPVNSVEEEERRARRSR